MQAPRKSELEALAFWLAELRLTPQFQTAIDVLKYRYDLKLQEIIHQREALTDWDRGYAACLDMLINKPQELITQFVEGDTSETPATSEE